MEFFVFRTQWKSITFKNYFFTKGLPSCSVTKEIRNNFHQRIKSVIYDFKHWTFDPKFKYLPILDIPLEMEGGEVDFIERQSIDSMKEEIANAITENQLEISEVSKWPFLYFGMTESLENVVGHYINRTNDPDYTSVSWLDYSWYQDSNKVNCSSKKCQQNLKVVDNFVQVLMHVMNIEPNIQFGNFLATFVPNQNVRGSRKKINIFDYQRSASKETRLDCNSITDDDRWLHAFFAKLSKSIGFKGNESISLYEIPAILATLDWDQMKSATLPQAFTYTRCKGKRFAKIDVCNDIWMKFMKQNQNQTGKNLRFFWRRGITVCVYTNYYLIFFRSCSTMPGKESQY